MNQRTTRQEKLQIRGELFALCSAGGDSDLKRAADIIRKMSMEERRDVRAGIQTLSHSEIPVLRRAKADASTATSVGGAGCKYW